MDHATVYLTYFLQLTIQYLPRLALALLTLVVGLWLINRVVGLFERRLKERTDETLHHFLRSLISIGLKALLLISVASMVGIQTTSFIAVLGAAGLAVGLALQGSLANFAGGVLILTFKPFKVGDAIEAEGFAGVVREIQIFNTVLTSFDNRRVIIPNGKLANNSVININAEPRRRVDMTFGIGYGDDVGRAKAVLQSLVEADARILADPAPTIALGALGESSVDLVCRVWVETPDYWGVYYAMHEGVKARFDAEGISIPFPQRDVHLYQHGS